MPNDKDALLALLRSDFRWFLQKSFATLNPGSKYAHNWHIDAMIYEVERCISGNTRRLIVNVPPRHLKSIVFSVVLPAWILGHDPTRRIICASYSEALAKKHSNDCRKLMEEKWYREAFPKARLSKEKNTELEFATTQTGFRLATSVGGTLTGRGGDYIIIDDPLKPEEAASDTSRERVNEWFDSTLYSRLDDKLKGRIILVMQRLHLFDLVGHVKQGDNWRHLSIPAIAPVDEKIATGPRKFYSRKEGDVLHPAREPLTVLKQLETMKGSVHFSAQYQQNPLPPGGEIVKKSWFEFYDYAPKRREGDLIVQSWDTASKAGELNSYSVCTTWLRRSDDHYLLDVFRERVEFPDLVRAALRLARERRPDAVLIEDKGSGTQLIQELRHRCIFRPIKILPEGDKIMRLSNQSPKVEAGHVFLPSYAPWFDDFIREVTLFPASEYSDQVDSLSQYLAWEGPRKLPQIIVHYPMKRQTGSLLGPNDKVW